MLDHEKEPTTEEVLSRMPDGDRAVMEKTLAGFKKTATRNAMIAIVMRNLSHGIGSWILHSK